MDERYQTKCTMTDKGPISGNLYEQLQPTLDEVNRDLTDPEIVDSIVVDRKNRIVKLVKGAIDPFIPGLNAKLPGWQEGTIEEQ